MLEGNRIFEMEVIREEKKQPNIEAQLEEIVLHTKENAPEKIKNNMNRLKSLLRECMCDRQSIGTVLQRIADAIRELCKNLHL